MSNLVAMAGQELRWTHLPTGRMTKKGNQQSRKAPTTIPSVLAAFFCRRNLNILADSPVLDDDVLPGTAEDVDGTSKELAIVPAVDGRLDPLRCP